MPLPTAPNNRKLCLSQQLPTVPNHATPNRFQIQQLRGSMVVDSIPRSTYCVILIGSTTCKSIIEVWIPQNPMQGILY